MDNHEKKSKLGIVGSWVTLVVCGLSAVSYAIGAFTGQMPMNKIYMVPILTLAAIGAWKEIKEHTVATYLDQKSDNDGTAEKGRTEETPAEVAYRYKDPFKKKGWIKTLIQSTAFNGLILIVCCLAILICIMALLHGHPSWSFFVLLFLISTALGSWRQIKKNFVAQYMSEQKTESRPSDPWDIIKPFGSGVSYWEKILAMTPGVKSLGGLARLYVHSGEQDRALEIYTSCFGGLRTSEAEVLEGMSLAYYISGDHGNALESLNALMALRPEKRNDDFDRLFDELSKKNPLG